MPVITSTLDFVSPTDAKTKEFSVISVRTVVEVSKQGNGGKAGVLFVGSAGSTITPGSTTTPASTVLLFRTIASQATNIPRGDTRLHSLKWHRCQSHDLPPFSCLCRIDYNLLRLEGLDVVSEYCGPALQCCFSSVVLLSLLQNKSCPGILVAPLPPSRQGLLDQKHHKRQFYNLLDFCSALCFILRINWI